MPVREGTGGPPDRAAPACIGYLWLFAELKPEELGALVAATQRHFHRKGEEGYSQGKPARKMFLIKGGRVKLSKLTEAGDEITLDIRKSGDFLGENLLLEDTICPYFAQSI